MPTLPPFSSSLGGLSIVIVVVCSHRPHLTRTHFFWHDHSLSCNRQFNPTYCYVCSAVELVSFQNYSTNGRRTGEHTFLCLNKQKCVQTRKSVFKHTKVCYNTLFVCSNTLLCIRIEYTKVYCNKLHADCGESNIERCDIRDLHRPLSSH